ncbi:MAG: 4'-phosphopantetheinyl transferase superfamily protein [Salinibacter sp.]
MKADALADRLPAAVGLHAVTYDATAEWTSWLSAAERACVAGFGAESRRREFVAGRAAARELLAGRLSTTPSAVPLRRDADGGVTVEAGPWHVSIAHSGPHALAVCAPHVVGADLEQIQARDSGIAEFLFRPADRGLIDRLPYGPDAALILCWTLKEAVLKARRSGFRTSPKDLRLTVAPATETAAVEVEGNGRWRLHYGRLRDYWAAVALPDRVDGSPPS